MSKRVGKKSSSPSLLAQTIGNILIGLSLLFLVVLYLPFLKLLFPQPINVDKFAQQKLAIVIPKIQAAAPIITDVDPWNPTDYRAKLKLGVAHAQGTALPGEQGTSYLFAHSSDLPWNLTRYNTVFLKLGELNLGDEIIIYKSGQKLIYQVTDKKIVLPTEVKYLTQASNKNQLILQTCTPIGTALKRLLIFAEPISTPTSIPGMQKP